MDIFHSQLRAISNPLFARNSLFPRLATWALWSQSYGWIDEVDDILEGDTIAFGERLGCSPYPSLVVATVAMITGDQCDLTVIAHDARDTVPPGSLITRSRAALSRAEIKRWARVGEAAVGHIVPGSQPRGPMR